MKRTAIDAGKGSFWTLCAAAVFLSAGLFTYGSAARAAVFLSAVCSGAAAVLLFCASRKTLKENFYSVASAILPGLCLSAFCLACTSFALALRISGETGPLEKLHIFWGLLRTAAVCILPLILSLSVLLIISNIISIIWLVRNGRGDVINFQGFLSAAVLCGSSAAVVFSGSLFPPSAAVWICPAILLFLSAAFMLFSALVILRVTEKRQPGMDKDFLIILGCGMYSDGRPSSMLRNRMKAGIRHYEEQLRTSGKKAVFIVSGGQGPDEICSEADAMKAWLSDQGIPADRILSEDRSRTTEENMIFSKAIIDRIAPDARAAFCTTNFHAFRAGIKARKAGLEAEGITYNTEWYFWYNAAVREVVGLLVEAILKSEAPFYHPKNS